MRHTLFLTLFLVLLTSCSEWKMDIPLENGNVSVWTWEINYTDENSNISVSTWWINGAMDGIWEIGISSENIQIWDMNIYSSGVEFWWVNTNELFQKSEQESESIDIENDPFFNQDIESSWTLEMWNGTMNINGNTMTNQ